VQPNFFRYIRLRFIPGHGALLYGDSRYLETVRAGEAYPLLPLYGTVGTGWPPPSALYAEYRLY